MSNISDIAWVSLDNFDNSKAPYFEGTQKTNTKNEGLGLTQGHLDSAKSIFEMSLGIGQNVNVYA